ASTEIVVAADTEANPASSSYRIAWGHGTDASGQLRQVWKDTGSALSAADTDNYTGFVSGRAWSATPLVAVSEFSSAALRLWTAGSAAASTSNYSFSTGTGAARVGSKVSGGQYWYGVIPEVIVFNTTL